MSNYTEASRLYRGLGWDVIAPSQLPPDSKRPASAVHNVFGRGNAATQEQMDAWERDFPYRNCLLKMNRGIIGIDIDHYLKWSNTRNKWIRKRGFDHISEAISRYGDYTLPSAPRPEVKVSHLEFSSTPLMKVSSLAQHLLRTLKSSRTTTAMRWFGLPFTLKLASNTSGTGQMVKNVPLRGLQIYHHCHESGTHP